MSRLTLGCMILLAAVVYLALLGWFGNRFLSYAKGTTDLSLENRDLAAVALGDSLTVDLAGSGFDRATRVQLQLEVNNQEAIVGSFPLEGSFSDLLLDGDQLFLASLKDGLHVFSLANPVTPVYERNYMPRVSILDIEKSGPYYILSCGTQGIYILEKRQDKGLSEVRRLYSTGVAIESRVVGDYLYVVAGTKGLLIYDLGNAEEDRPISILNLGEALLGIETYQDRLYLATSRAGVQVYQVQEQGRLLSLGRFAQDKAVRGLTRVAENLYLSESSRISLYQLGAAPLPELLQEEVFSGNPRSLHLAGDTLFVADSFNALNRLALAQGYRSSGYIAVGGVPRAMVSKGSYLYTAVNNSGLLVVDQRAVLPRQVEDVVDSLHHVSDLYIRDRWLYIADGHGGLRLISLDNKTAPVVQLTADNSRWLAAAGDLLYVDKTTRGVEIFNIADPAAPKRIASMPELKNVIGLVRVADYLLLTKGSHGLALVDISDVNNPLVSETLDAVHAFKMDLVNGLIYVAADHAGVLIYRIARGRLEQLGAIVPPFPLDGFSAAMEVKVKNGIAYVANGSGGLLIADVHDPRKIKILSSIALPGLASSLTIEGSRVYVACRNSGLQIVEVSDLKNPQLETSIPLHGLTSGIQIVDGMIYLGNGYAGVSAIPVPQQIKSFKVLSAEKLRVTLPSPNQPGRYRLQVSNKTQTATLRGVVRYQAVQNL